ncbi:MAG: homoserine kinase [Actinomycetota bacterium]|nr:homoserine kinase [Actinomycetota bacterium]
MPALRADAIQVRVPATSANLGPGFDALGLALTLHDDLVARVAGEGLMVDVAGEGQSVSRDETHLVIRAMRAAFAELGSQPRGLELACTNRIPHGRGLGSSAAAIVAGVLLARALVVGGDEELPEASVLALAGAIEGHPDNVSACLLGGLTVAWTERGRSHGVRAPIGGVVTPVVLVAPFEAATAQARGLLPDNVSHGDATFTAGRSALLVAALAGAGGALLAATEDRLHQRYRAAAMPQTADLVDRLRSSNLAAVVSGAGPSVLVLARDELEVQAARAVCPTQWRCELLEVDRQGALVRPAGMR